MHCGDHLRPLNTPMDDYFGRENVFFNKKHQKMSTKRTTKLKFPFLFFENCSSFFEKWFFLDQNSHPWNCLAASDGHHIAPGVALDIIEEIWIEISKHFFRFEVWLKNIEIDLSRSSRWSWGTLCSMLPLLGMTHGVLSGLPDWSVGPLTIL